jgi:hypothetical protein
VVSIISLYYFLYCYRLIREGLCDRGSAPSISAISRLLRGHDGDDSASEKKVSDGKFILPFKKYIQYTYAIYMLFLLWQLQLQ